MLGLKSQVDFVQSLFFRFLKSAKEYIDNEKQNEGNPSYYSKNYMNKNCGKTALKRKITLIRQELLNLEKMLDGE